MKPITKDELTLSTHSAPYPLYLIKDDKGNTTDGRIVVSSNINESGEYECINPDKISSIFYTTEGGYSYNHPFERAREQSIVIAQALNIKSQTGLTPKQISEQASELLKQRDELLEALTEFRDRAVRGEIQVFHDGENPFMGIDKALKSITKQS